MGHAPSGELDPKVDAGATGCTRQTTPLMVEIVLWPASSTSRPVPTAPPLRGVGAAARKATKPFPPALPTTAGASSNGKSAAPASGILGARR